MSPISFRRDPNFVIRTFLDYQSGIIGDFLGFDPSMMDLKFWLSWVDLDKLFRKRVRKGLQQYRLIEIFQPRPSPSYSYQSGTYQPKMDLCVRDI